MSLTFGRRPAPQTSADPLSADPAGAPTGPGTGFRAYRLTRSGGFDANPQNFASQASVFAQTAVGSGGSATIVVQRNGASTDNWVIVTDAAAEANAQMTLARTVGARIVPDPGPDLLGQAESITRLTHVPAPMMRDPQLGYDPSTLAGMLATSMTADGTWLAITIRSATHREQKLWRKWLDHRFGQHNPTHHSIQAGAVVTTLTAGGPSANAANNALQTAKAGMPGFDLHALTTPPAGRTAAIKPLSLGAAALVAGLFTPTGITLITDTISEAVASSGTDITALTALLPLAGTLLQWILFAAAAILGLPAALKLVGALPTDDARIRKDLDRNIFPAPPRHLGRVRPPRAAGTKTTYQNVNGSRIPVQKEIREFEGDYPLHPASFLLGASVFAGIASPHGTTGEVTTAERNVPPAMVRPIGPWIATSGGQPVHLDATMMTLGTAIVGQPGSGKSVAVRTLFGWSALERVQPAGLPGFPGKANSLIAFESKGDGMYEYVQWAHSVGDQILAIDVVDPTTPSIDLFDVGGTIEDKANFFTNAMKYTFGEDAIGFRSFATLQQVLTAGQAVTDKIIESIDTESDPSTARIFTPGHSPIWWAHVLLAGSGPGPGVTLYNALRSAAQAAHDAEAPDENLDIAVYHLRQLYDGVTDSQRRTLQEAPRSKTQQLLNMEKWFAPTRRRVSWSDILNQHRSVVINTGPSVAGSMEEQDIQVMSSMLMFSLRAAIQKHCSGWESQQRYVSLFADELSLLAGSSEEIVGWIRDQGRSFGIRAIFATQRPEQLAPRLRNNFLTYSTLISYSQNDVATGKEVAANMGSDWSADDLRNLPPYHAVVRGVADKQAQPSFTAAMSNFESDRSGFAAAQKADQSGAPVLSNQQSHSPAQTFESELQPYTPPPADPNGPAPSRYGVGPQVAPPAAVATPTPGADLDLGHNSPGGAW